MQLTRFTDYSLRVLIYLGIRQEEWVTIRQISDAYGISRNHLMKVVSFLASNDYLVSQRGPGGGIRLKRPPHEINLAEVIIDAEGRIVHDFVGQAHADILVEHMNALLGSGQRASAPHASASSPPSS